MATLSRQTISVGLAVLLVIAACKSEDATPGEAARPPVAAAGELTPAQLERGIGPVTRVELGPVDDELAEEGREIFEMKCAFCHRLEGRYVGPPLGDVMARRTPEFVMNMMLNPAEMVEKHPAVKELLAQYFTPMPDQNLNEEEARAVLEYLRRPRPEEESS